jgi:DnaJ-class molecular chaperone
MGMLVERPCGWCGGSGDILVGTTLGTKEKCDVCNGAGYLRIDSSATTCPDCQGTGEASESQTFLSVIVGSERRCSRCNGTGWAVPPRR